jgi:AcrR family transcriptional regulator
MPNPSKFRESVRTLLRDRLLDAAQSITVESGWAAVTMAKIADLAGVSRQTVYNEFGTKPELADALVVRELMGFLDVVRTRLLAHDDPVDGLRDACTAALALAEENPLVRAALSSANSTDNDLLPLLTTDSQGLINTAVDVVAGVITEHYGDVGLPPEQLRVAADAVVRLVLSHITRPAVTPAEAGEQIAWIAERLIPAKASAD